MMNSVEYKEKIIGSGKAKYKLECLGCGALVFNFSLKCHHVGAFCIDCFEEKDIEKCMICEKKIGVSDLRFFVPSEAENYDGFEYSNLSLN